MGIRVKGLGFMLRILGFGSGLGFRVSGFGGGVQGLVSASFAFRCMGIEGANRGLRCLDLHVVGFRILNNTIPAGFLLWLSS